MLNYFTTQVMLIVWEGIIFLLPRIVVNQILDQRSSVAEVDTKRDQLKYSVSRSI